MQWKNKRQFKMMLIKNDSSIKKEESNNNYVK